MQSEDFSPNNTQMSRRDNSSEIKTKSPNFTISQSHSENHSFVQNYGDAELGHTQLPFSLQAFNPIGIAAQCLHATIQTYAGSKSVQSPDRRLMTMIERDDGQRNSDAQEKKTQNDGASNALASLNDREIDCLLHAFP